MVSAWQSRHTERGNAMTYSKNGFTFKFDRIHGRKAIWHVTLGGLHFAYVGTDTVIRALKA